MQEEVKRVFVTTRNEMSKALGINGDLTEWSVMERGKTAGEDKIKLYVTELKED